MVIDFVIIYTARTYDQISDIIKSILPKRILTVRLLSLVQTILKIDHSFIAFQVLCFRKMYKIYFYINDFYYYLHGNTIIYFYAANQTPNRVILIYVYSLHLCSRITKNHFRGIKKPAVLNTRLVLKTVDNLFFFFLWQSGYNFCPSRQLTPAVVGLSIPTRLLYTQNLRPYYIIKIIHCNV